MSRKAKNETQQDNKEKTLVTPEQQIEEYLNREEVIDNHYNFLKEINYLVSGGSLAFDIETNGGIRPGITRMSGASEAGKTSETLELMRNFFLDKRVKRRGLLVKAEGRLSKEMILRSGVKFVDQPNEWTEGTCFVLKTNIYETAIGALKELVKNNPLKYQYFFVIDCMDALIPKEDQNRPTQETNRVAGTASLSTDFLRKMALAMTNRGHICILISQVRSQITINPYQKQDVRLTNASGGFAVLHYSDWIFEFQHPYNKDFIWEGEEGKSKKLGHYCKVIFRKSVNEKTGTEVKYPIKYHQTNGHSIWVELEVIDQLITWGFVAKKGKWFTPSASLLKELTENKLTIPEQFDGMLNFRKYIESNPDLVNYLYNKFRNTLINLTQDTEPQPEKEKPETPQPDDEGI